jgi:hypothetical protein
MLGSSSDKVKLDAANSILDRGGVPKTAQVDVEARLSLESALAAVIDYEADPEPQPVFVGPVIRE